MTNQNIKNDSKNKLIIILLLIIINLIIMEFTTKPRKKVTFLDPFDIDWSNDANDCLWGTTEGFLQNRKGPSCFKKDRSCFEIYPKPSGRITPQMIERANELLVNGGSSTYDSNIFTLFCIDNPSNRRGCRFEFTFDKLESLLCSLDTAASSAGSYTCDEEDIFLIFYVIYCFFDRNDEICEIFRCILGISP